MGRTNRRFKAVVEKIVRLKHRDSHGKSRKSVVNGANHTRRGVLLGNQKEIFFAAIANFEITNNYSIITF